MKRDLNPKKMEKVWKDEDRSLRSGAVPRVSIDIITGTDITKELVETLPVKLHSLYPLYFDIKTVKEIAEVVSKSTHLDYLEIIIDFFFKKLVLPSSLNVS
eukprot:TCONS_00000213-protein